MKKKALRFTAEDNVLVLTWAAGAGESVKDPQTGTIYTLTDDVPAGHKVACENIGKNEKIIKYGHEIGTASCDIPIGSHVHTQNVKSSSVDWKKVLSGYRCYPNSVQEVSDSFLLKEKPALTGYRRKNGLVGFRNHLLVISTVVCANHIVEELGRQHRDMIAIANPSGCILLENEMQRVKTILISMARNPNVGGVIFVGLGCEGEDAGWYCREMGDEKPNDFIRIQDDGDERESYKRLEAMALKMREELASQKREEASVADIRVGTECGGSDWTTAIVSNPAIGIVSDIIVRNGGVSLLGESYGWFGGERKILSQARSQESADRILRIMMDIYSKAKAMGRKIEEGNPSPGNMDGGLTTLPEKALGNVEKGGTAPIEDVLDFGEYPSAKGLYLVDNPGIDPASLLGLTCSSANVILFSTGRGTPTGTPLAPVVKLTGSPEAGQRFKAHIDVDLSPVVSGSLSLEEAGQMLYRKLISAVNGEPTISEVLGNREYVFPLLMGVI